MQIKCPRCGNDKRFIVPVWVRATVRFEGGGDVKLLHTRFLEPVEEKLIDGKVKCAECRAKAEVVTEAASAEKRAMEAL